MDKQRRSNHDSILSRARRVLRGRQEEQRSAERLLVERQRLGDVVSDRPVVILASGSIGGNVTAPEVHVHGMVQGSIATRELIVESAGQVWGDVYAAAVTVAPGGKVHGWLTTLDEGTVDLLRDGTIGVTDLPIEPADHEGASRGNLDQAETRNASETVEMAFIIRQLQAEAATAVMARAELEAQFEARVAQAVDADIPSKASQKTLESPADFDENQRQQAAVLDRLRKLQIALARSLQRIKELEADLAYREATGGGTTESQTGDADHWSRISKTVAAAQITYYQGAVEAHSEQVARLQAELVERDLLLERLQLSLREQAGQLDDLKRRAAKRINQLERELERQRRRSLGAGS